MLTGAGKVYSRSRSPRPRDLSGQVWKHVAALMGRNVAGVCRRRTSEFETNLVESQHKYWEIPVRIGAWTFRIKVIIVYLKLDIYFLIVFCIFLRLKRQKHLVFYKLKRKYCDFTTNHTFTLWTFTIWYYSYNNLIVNKLKNTQGFVINLIY